MVDCGIETLPMHGISARSSTQSSRMDAKSNMIAKSAGQFPRHRVLNPITAGVGCEMWLSAKAWEKGTGTKGVNMVN